MKQEAFESVWDALEASPEEAEHMKLRSALMIAVKEELGRLGLTQAKAAQLLGVTQPRVSDLMRGKVQHFALDGLVRMAVALGLRVSLTVEGPAQVA